MGLIYCTHNREWRNGPCDRCNVEALTEKLNETSLENGDLRAEVVSLTARAERAEGATREAFVAGAAWAEFELHGATIWNSDRNRAEEEAEVRYPNGAWPTSALIAHLESALAAERAAREKDASRLAEVEGALKRILGIARQDGEHRIEDIAASALLAAPARPEEEGK